MTATKPTHQITLELRKFFVSRGMLTTISIAESTGINQSQIHRNLFGKPKRLSKTLIFLCKYANISTFETTLDPRESVVLMEALGAVWDGSEEHACRLADLLFAHSRAGMRR